MAKPRQATVVMISRKLQLKWRSFSAIVRLTLPEPLEKEEKLAMICLARRGQAAPLGRARRIAKLAFQQDVMSDGARVSSTGRAMLDHDRARVARLLDRGEGN